MRTQRHICLLAVSFLFVLDAAAQSLNVRLEGTQLRVSAPTFHFLIGDTLRRLQDGASVTFTFQLGAKPARDGEIRDLVTARFIVSYDLWEEKYAVTRSGAAARSISYLSLPDAERWCLDLLSLPAGGMAEDTPFWVTLSYRIENPSPPAPDGSPRTNLGTLIEIFSQRADPRPQTVREITAGPFRLSELRLKR